MESLGYETVAFPTGWPFSEMENASYYITPEMTQLESLQEGGRINAFEGILLRTTWFRALTDLDEGRTKKWFIEQLQYEHFNHRLRVLSILRNLGTVPFLSGNKFVFAHVISPHSPYIFGPNGEEILQDEPFTLLDLAIGEGGRDTALYRGQLIFLNSQLENTIEQILINSSEPPIIIIQSDHGQAVAINWYDPDDEDVRARSAILNAYYLPKACQDDLYPEISPVNSFRLIFRCVYGLDYELLPDGTYFSNARVDAFELSPVDPQLLDRPQR